MQDIDVYAGLEDVPVVLWVLTGIIYSVHAFNGTCHMLAYKTSQLSVKGVFHQLMLESPSVTNVILCSAVPGHSPTEILLLDGSRSAVKALLHRLTPDDILCYHWPLLGVTTSKPIM
jgi:hypothetical protein